MEEKKETSTYTYSAKEQEEIKNIRASFYLITTGFDEPKPRSYSITEVSGTDLEKIMTDNHLKMWMFE